MIKGYKVFNPDWTCREKQYTCPGKFEEDVNPKACHAGMHFCKNAVDCFDYYNFNPKNKVAEVVAYGDIAEEGNKCCTNKLKIVREIPWTELLEIVNMGKGCTGRGNSGNRNSGNCNSGDFNSGNCNSGDRNSGNRNSGDFNSGNWNSGNRNSGDFNSGNCNSGDWNETNYSSGCFNTTEQKIYLFNRLSDWTYSDWLISRARDILCHMPQDCLVWVLSEKMSDEEKAANPTHETTDGFLREVKAKSRQEWWDNLPDEDKSAVMSIPNFDAKIFGEITGIVVVKDGDNNDHL